MSSKFLVQMQRRALFLKEKIARYGYELKLVKNVLRAYGLEFTPLPATPSAFGLARRLARFLKKQRGDTPQWQFSRAIGVSKPTYARLENGEQKLTVTMIVRLCDEFKCDISDLFPRE